MDDKTEGFALGLIIAALLYLLIQGHLHKNLMAGSRAGRNGAGASGGAGGAAGSGSSSAAGSGGCGCGGAEKVKTGIVVQIGGQSYSGKSGFSAAS